MNRCYGIQDEFREAMLIELFRPECEIFIFYYFTLLSIKFKLHQ